MAELNETIALVEVGGSHDECLLTQLQALNEFGCDVVMVCTQDIRERNPAFEPLVSHFHIVRFSGSKTNRFQEVRRALRFMEQEGVTRAVLNTAQGDLIRNLAVLALFSSIEFTGIIHTTRKLKGSFTQRVIHRKVRKYLLLSEYLLSTVPAPKDIRLDYFYPIVFDGIRERESHEGLPVAIIGGVERRRKDIDGFCRMLEQLDNSVHFTFLGKSDPSHPDVQWLEIRLQEMGRRHQVTLYHEFVSHEKFNRQLAKTDFILPLVHPDTPSADQYFRNQISGAMTVAFGYKIPLLVHEAYAHIEEMKFASFYYSLEKFGEVLNAADTGSKQEEMENAPACSPEIQKERFRNFVLTP